VAQLQQLVSITQPALPELAANMQSAGLIAAMADWSLGKMAYVQVRRWRPRGVRGRAAGSTGALAAALLLHQVCSFSALLLLLLAGVAGGGPPARHLPGPPPALGRAPHATAPTAQAIHPEVYASLSASIVELTKWVARGPRAWMAGRCVYGCAVAGLGGRRARGRLRLLKAAPAAAGAPARASPACSLPLGRPPSGAASTCRRPLSPPSPG
jgi:hypothetical protein